MKYDLETRTIKFSINIIKFFKNQEQNTASQIIIRQAIKSATSIGANYSEANNSISISDFKNKIYISRKEAQETLYWIKIYESICSETRKTQLAELKKECVQLVKIFASISIKTKYKVSKN